MSSKILVAILVIIVGIAGYAYTRTKTPITGVTQQNQNTMMDTKTNVSEKNDTMMPSTHTMPDGTIMNSNTNANTDAMAGGHMMPDGTIMGSVMDTPPPSSGATKEMMQIDNAMTAHGSYEVYSPEKLVRAETGKVVLFFRASWCPTCKMLDSDIKLNLMDIPKNVTILEVNYDTSTDLKTKYGVTYQHTLVEVDAKGNLIRKWNGSPTLSALLKEIK